MVSIWKCAAEDEISASFSLFYFQLFFKVSSDTAFIFSEKSQSGFLGLTSEK